MAVSWFLPDQEFHGAAMDVLRLVLAGDVEALAPRYLRYEFCNALTKAYRIRGRTFAELSTALDAFQRVPISYIGEPHSLVTRAAFLAHTFKKAFYDMGYFAVAEVHSVPVCTADTGSVAGLGSDFAIPYVLLQEMTG